MREPKFRARFRKISNGKECWQMVCLSGNHITELNIFGYIQVTDWEQLFDGPDKNGNDIYEGDIMIHPDFIKGQKLVVEFVNGCFCLGGWDCVRTDFSKGEVIGNIHETPDLMGE